MAHIVIARFFFRYLPTFNNHILGLYYCSDMTDRSPFPDLATPVPPPRKKRRRAITDAEKKELRDHWGTLPAGDHKTHKALIQWFEEIHYHKIFQSTVSEILSTKYTRLDNLKKPEYPDRRKNRGCKLASIGTSTQRMADSCSAAWCFCYRGSVEGDGK